MRAAPELPGLDPRGAPYAVTISLHYMSVEATKDVDFPEWEVTARQPDGEIIASTTYRDTRLVMYKWSKKLSNGAEVLIDGAVHARLSW